MLGEAIRLGEESKFAEALQLWQTLGNLPSLDIESKCAFLLGERRCYSGLGHHQLAMAVLDKVEELDTCRQFWVEVEFARISDLRLRGKVTESNRRLKQFVKENAELLASPRYADLVYEYKCAIGCALVNANETVEGLQLLNDVLPLAEEQDKSMIYFYLGVAYENLNNPDAAVAEYKRVLGSSGDDLWAGSAYYRLGLIYESKGALAWAKQYLESAEKLKEVLTFPLAYVHMSLSNVCVRLNQLDEARRYRRLAESASE
jgi:tetratricopeptide (TPR) repeat protein